MKSINYRNLVEKWISGDAYPRKILKATRRFYSLLNINTMSDKTEGSTSNFYMALTRKWKDCSQRRRYLFKRHCVTMRLGKEINIHDISSKPGNRENTNKY